MNLLSTDLIDIVNEWLWQLTICFPLWIIEATPIKHSNVCWLNKGLDFMN